MNEVFGWYNKNQKEMKNYGMRSTDNLQYEKIIANRSLIMPSDTIISKKNKNFIIAPGVRKCQKSKTNIFRKLSPKANIHNYSYLAMADRQQSPLGKHINNTTFTNDYRMKINSNMKNKKIKDNKLKDFTIDFKLEDMGKKIKTTSEPSIDLRRAKSTKRVGRVPKQSESKTNLYTSNGLILADLSPASGLKESKNLKQSKKI